MKKGIRFRCYPTKEQEQSLLQWVGCQRFIYNAKVSEDYYFRTFFRKFGVSSHDGTQAPIDAEYSRFITEKTPWLRDVPSQILRQGAYLWNIAYSRYFARLGGRPVFHKKTGKQSVWITSELFCFKYNEKTHQEELWLGTKKFQIGFLSFTAHTAWEKPKSLHISVENGKWYVSFSYDDGFETPKDQDLVKKLRTFSEQDLLSCTIGFDRGAVLPVMASDRQTVEILPVCLKRAEAKEVKRKRYQRQLKRQVLGSKNRNKTKAKISQTYEYGRNVRKDTAHKGTHAFVSNSGTRLFVLEDLKIKNITKKPKAKKDQNGKFVKNGARGKAGLHKAILESCWGLFAVLLAYKARKNWQLVIKVPPHYSSQECALCEHTHKDNRVKQDLFVCQCCGHRDNADHNVAVVLAKRGVKLLLSEGFELKTTTKRCGIRKTQHARDGVSQGVCGELSKTKKALPSLHSSAKQKIQTAKLEAATTATIVA